MKYARKSHKFYGVKNSANTSEVIRYVLCNASEFVE